MLDVSFQILIVLAIHFVADFLFQTDWMAMNKSHNVKALASHVAVYVITFYAIGIIFFPASQVIIFTFFTWVFHFVTDSVSSKITTKLYKEQRTRAFFNVIGFDQFLHALQLILCYKFIIINNLVL